MEIIIEIQNLGLLKDFKAEFKSGNLYYIQGSNGQGKTTLLKAIETLSTGIVPKGDNLTKGETNGSVKGTYELDGANGVKYKVIWNLTEKTNTFTIIDPSTNVLKSTSRNNVIADIFKYNSFTVDEWFAWGLTAEGRRKQCDILLNLLPEEAKQEYLKIDSEINEQVGTLYIKRTTENKEYDKIKAVVDSNKLSEDEEKLLLEKDKINKDSEEINKKYESALSNDRTTLETELSTLKESQETKLSQKNKDILSEDTSILEQQTLIKEYEEKIKTANKKIEECNNKKKISIDIFKLDIAKIANRKIEIDEALSKLIVVDIETIKKEKSEIDTKITNITLAENKKNNNITNNKNLQTKFDIIEDLNKTIEDKRKRKKTIIEENKLPSDLIIIENGEVFYKVKDGKVPFIESNVSYSEGGMIVANLMAKINKTLPIWLIGKASEYDNDRIKEFVKLAKDNNGIIIADRVIEEANTPLTIKCIEN
jgi:DNA repair exonuclease SbcCD ATPase subunit